MGSPSKTTDLPAQMSDDWIDYITNKLTKDSKTKKLGDKLEEVRLSNPDLIKKYVSAVDQATGELNFLKLKSY